MKPSRCIALALLLLSCTGAQAQQVCPQGIVRTTPNSHFADAGTGMVRHAPSGLIWKRCAEGQHWNAGTQACTGSAARYTWQQAFERAEAVNQGAAGSLNHGRTDWRVPNANELMSVVELACMRPAINPAQFHATPAATFWTSSPDITLRAAALAVNFATGHDFGSTREQSHHLRLVRGGASGLDYQAGSGRLFADGFE